MKRNIYKEKCKCCNNQFEFKAFRTEIKKRLFCSRICANKFNASRNSKSKIGKQNPMYGKRPYNWKAKTISSDGYYLIWVDNKKVREHRYFMEQIIGRKLTRSEVVHHKDGNKLNNISNNLTLCKNEKEHRKYHKITRNRKGQCAKG